MNMWLHFSMISIGCMFWTCSQCWLAVLVYPCQHGIAPPYLGMNYTVWLRWVMTAVAFSGHYGVGHAKYIPLHDWRPFYSRNSCLSLEQSSTVGDIITIDDDSFSAVSQDGTVYLVIWLKLAMTVTCGLYLLFMLLLYWPSHFHIFIAFSWQLFMLKVMCPWSTSSTYDAIWIVVRNNNLFLKFFDLWLRM